MKVSVPYITVAAIGVLAFYGGVSGAKVPLISNTRTAAIVVAAAGFFMCTFGSMGRFVGAAPAHFLSSAGYILGVLALFTAAVLVFGFDVPLLKEPSTALLVLTTVILIKVVIARVASSWI